MSIVYSYFKTRNTRVSKNIFRIRVWAENDEKWKLHLWIKKERMRQRERSWIFFSGKIYRNLDNLIEREINFSSLIQNFYVLPWYRTKSYIIYRRNFEREVCKIRTNSNEPVYIVFAVYENVYCNVYLHEWKRTALTYFQRATVPSTLT